jgi:hypothetical protein
MRLHLVRMSLKIFKTQPLRGCYHGNPSGPQFTLIQKLHESIGENPTLNPIPDSGVIEGVAIFGQSYFCDLLTSNTVTSRTRKRWGNVRMTRLLRFA